MTTTPTTGPVLDLDSTDLFVCTGLEGPHAFYDHLAEVWHAAGIADPDAALALMQDAVPVEDGPYPTTADLPAFRLRWFAYSHPVTDDDLIVTAVPPAAPGAFPDYTWRPCDPVA